MLCSVLQMLGSVQSCPTLYDPKDCSTPGFPIQLPELAQTHVHGVVDTIRPSHRLLGECKLPFSESWASRAQLGSASRGAGAG